MDSGITAIIAFDLTLFVLAFAFSMKFLRSSLFADQELKQGHMNQYIFSFTFA